MIDQRKTDWFRELDRHEERLFRICWALLRDRDLALEAVQETYVAFLSNVSKYDPQRPLEPWLNGMARNKAISMLRRRQVRTSNTIPLGAERDLAEEAVDAEPSPEENVIRSELENLLSECCLPSLTEAQEEALRLDYYHRLSRREISARMGLTEDSVGGHLKRGKESLRAHILNEHPEFVDSVDWSEFNE